MSLVEYPYGVKFRTIMPVDELEEWLDRHCAGAFLVSFDGFSENMKEKIIVVRFAAAKDRDNFAAAHGKSIRKNP